MYSLVQHGHHTTKYLQVYQRFQAPEGRWGYRCNFVIFNKSVNEKNSIKTSIPQLKPTQMVLNIVHHGSQNKQRVFCMTPLAAMRGWPQPQGVLYPLPSYKGEKCQTGLYTSKILHNQAGVFSYSFVTRLRVGWSFVRSVRFKNCNEA